MKIPPPTITRRVDELVAGIHVASDSARHRGDVDLADGLRLLARSGEELQAMLEPCTCPGQAHAVGCPQLDGARDVVVAALDDQGLGALASLVSNVLSPVPLTEETTAALAAVRIAMGGKR